MSAGMLDALMAAKRQLEELSTNLTRVRTTLYRDQSTAFIRQHHGRDTADAVQTLDDAVRTNRAVLNKINATLPPESDQLPLIV